MSGIEQNIRKRKVHLSSSGSKIPQDEIESKTTESISAEKKIRRKRRLRKCFSLGDADNEWNNKLILLEKAYSSDPVDITTLQQYAISRCGLIADDVRRLVWPKLLSINPEEISSKPTQAEIENYRDYNQVVLDVNRCLRRFPPGIEELRRMALQDQLIYLIVRVLLKHPELHYYQGYHDICITFLLAVGDELAFQLVEKVSLTHLRDFMEATMVKTSQTLNYLYPILGQVNSQLREHMENAGVGTIFCLSWLITWFGHVLNDYKHIVRLYDFFLACHPLMPVYLAAAIVLHRQNEVLAVECEMSAMHALLSNVPDNLPFEELIVKTGDLFLQYPPEQLASEVNALNIQGFMGLREPEAYSGSEVRQRKKTKEVPKEKATVRSLLRHGFALRNGNFVFPLWFTRHQSAYRVIVWTLTATAATAVYYCMKTSYFALFPGGSSR